MSRPLPSQKTRRRTGNSNPWLTELNLHTTITDIIDLEKRGVMSDHFGIITADAYLKEIARHREAAEPGDTIRLSPTEAHQIALDYHGHVYAGQRWAPTDIRELNSGDYLYGYEIEIQPPGTVFDRWTETPQPI